MNLVVPTLYGLRDMVADAVACIRGYEPLAGPDGYWVAFSGGKDSVVILELCRMAGVKLEAHHSLTTIDPPELVNFVRETPGVIIDRPERSFFQLLVDKKFPPSRHQRWCCEKLKEGGGKGRLVITGVRWAESARRSNRRQFEVCYRNKATRFLHPIIDWSDAQVWEFIRSRNLPYCCLYDQGQTRIGCLFCPMAKPLERKNHLIRYPKYANAFRRAFHRIIVARREAGLPTVRNWASGDEMFEWWVSEYKPEPVDGGLFT